ncbi:SulP family inorganic anion transporter [Carnimonas bestiolae]|uniref:SulP family inorganic anion transporter n=1 Tax=Carnimonas bestiolae TaxID=3402172 RepID=UPI003EDC8444
MRFARYRAQWSENPAREVLAGMVGTFALIPEVIAFSYVAGVPPAVSLFASFVISVCIALFGGRPGMISGAAGSVALIVAPLVHSHGIQYMLAATLLAGALQIVFGLCKLHVAMRFVSREVKTGFVNALAILIFSAQLPQMLGVDWHTYLLIALGLIIIYLLPRVMSVIPSPLVCIVVLTAIVAFHPMPVAQVADLGELPTGLPSLVWPSVPWNWDTLLTVAPYALAMAVVGLLESLMTAEVVQDATDSRTSPRMECTGQGISNIAVGLFGGIAGCGMVGQTVGNLRYGGVGRLSTFTAGAFLLILMVLLHDYVAMVPMAALVATMIMVSISTFDWRSLKGLVVAPKLSSLVMVATVVVTILTKDLAAGVAIGVLLSGIIFAWQAMKQVRITHQRDGDSDVYVITGQLFFASSDMLREAIDLRTDARRVVIDIRHAVVHDITMVSALDDIVARLQRHDVMVEVRGTSTLNHAMLDRYANSDVFDIKE